MICPICKAMIQDGSIFCTKCGRKIPQCPTCGKVIEKKLKFCTYDGTLLPESVISLFPDDVGMEKSGDSGTEKPVGSKGNSKRTEKPKKKRKRWVFASCVIAVTLVLLLAAASVGYAFLFGEYPWESIINKRSQNEPHSDEGFVLQDRDEEQENKEENPDDTADEKSNDDSIEAENPDDAADEKPNDDALEEEKRAAVEAQVAELTKVYNTQMRSYKNTYSLSSFVLSDCTLYYVDEELVEVDVNALYNNSNEMRAYYYNSSFLYRIEISDGSGDVDELFLDGDTPLQWIDPDGMEYDLSSPEMDQKLDFMLDEAYDYYAQYQDISVAITESQPEQVNYFPYTDNVYMDIEANLDVNAFERCSEVSGVTFYYPKYLFNQSSFSNNTAYFSYINPNTGDEEASLVVYRAPHSADKIARANEFKTYYEALCKSIFFSMVTDNADAEIAHALVGGYTDTEKRCGIYCIGANDGTYDYVLEFRFPEDDPDNMYSNGGYLYDCVYRYCSFSGSTYEARSYSDFIAGNRGQKK